MNRYYGNSMGRFTTPDPFGGSAQLARPNSWNRYAYVENDPVRNNDPSGLVLPGDFDGFDGDDWWETGAGFDPRPRPLWAIPIPRPEQPQGGGSGSPQPQAPSNEPSDEEVADNKRADILGDCLKSSFLEHFGLSAAAGVSGTLAMPIPKAWVPPFRTIGTDTTNLLSVIGHYVQVAIPRFFVGGLATNNLLRQVGRLNPYAALGLAAFDIGSIAKTTYDCYRSRAASAGL